MNIREILKTNLTAKEYAEISKNLDKINNGKGYAYITDSSARLQRNNKLSSNFLYEMLNHCSKIRCFVGVEGYKVLSYEEFAKEFLMKSREFANAKNKD